MGRNRQARTASTGSTAKRGTEFTSTAILAWAEDHRVAWHYIAPGKPTQNGFVERPDARRAAERELVLHPRSRSPKTGRLNRRLQHPAAAFGDARTRWLSWRRDDPWETESLPDGA